ncbi:hypothetical protein PTSG_00959 [Salpingoeca rosetta]|uniref:Essential protein Yae1 N-terminal domain-containing protein n=1 Tax=Salpingoeca rosetta (strain ATCC 50818 / BSB-021) TaxID=946362 RepID=F2TXZ7_SALR5|nr:uncharacterized protein PTSG_00959 [Salpingoeca rosetta]EGD76256.1 hypothetical protein PTSG_00959 [Salpingoeca rosetta]|eukprot:XP_004998431.1 hypothetical protein PTSG_00959 [Salpingoeca rosetta]
MDDLFDAVEALEVSPAQDAHEQGTAVGRSQGFVEGRHAGIQTGFSLGMEIGFYLSSIEQWTAQRPDICSTKRFQAHADKLKAAVDRIQRLSAGDETLDAALSDMRTAYTMVCNVLKIKQPFRMQETESSLSF